MYVCFVWILAPVPGGCNMEFSVETAPYLIVATTQSMIIVDSQPASAPMPRDKPAPPCESQHIQHEMYHMFLPERDFSSDTYFDSLLKMMTVHDIQLNGRQVGILLALIVACESNETGLNVASLFEYPSLFTTITEYRNKYYLNLHAHFACEMFLVYDIMILKIY
jgi:hypothetical protein